MNFNIAKYFWSLVEKTETCWLFNGRIEANGYGRIGSKKNRAFAHRRSYEMHNGPIPEGMVVMHTCDIRNCVNPNHLKLGTHEENMIDMLNKKRHRSQQVTQCPKGHEYTPENTAYKKGSNIRVCIACRRNWCNARSAVKRELKAKELAA